MNNIVLFISCVLEMYIFIDFFKAFFETKECFKSVWKQCAIATPMVLLYFGINTLHSSKLNLFTFFTILLIYATLVFQCTFKERILYLLFLCTIFFGCEFLFAVLLNIPSFIVGRKSIVDLSSMPWHVFTLKLLTYIICSIFKRLSAKSHRYFDTRVFLYYLFVPFSSIGIMLSTYYSGIDFSATAHTKILLCVCFGLLQFGNIVVFHAFQKYSKELHQSMQQKLLISEQAMKLDYYSKLQELNDRHRELIHNANQYIKTLGSLIARNEIKEALDCINELNIELETSSTIIWSSNNVLNSILSEKYTLAKSKNIDIDIYIEPEVQLDTIKDIDLINILCNLLDNAIEACEKCEGTRIVQTRIYNENHNSYSVIKIKNSFNGVLCIQDGQLISTKSQNELHGIGHKSVARTAEKYGGYLEYYEEDGLFVTVVLIPAGNANHNLETL